jgi:hypothetical protein
MYVPTYIFGNISVSVSVFLLMDKVLTR